VLGGGAGLDAAACEPTAEVARDGGGRGDTLKAAPEQLTVWPGTGDWAIRLTNVGGFRVIEREFQPDGDGLRIIAVSKKHGTVVSVTLEREGTGPGNSPAGREANPDASAGAGSTGGRKHQAHRPQGGAGGGADGEDDTELLPALESALGSFKHTRRTYKGVLQQSLSLTAGPADGSGTSGWVAHLQLVHSLHPTSRDTGRPKKSAGGHDVQSYGDIEETAGPEETSGSSPVEAADARRAALAERAGVAFEELLQGLSGEAAFAPSAAEHQQYGNLHFFNSGNFKPPPGNRTHQPPEQRAAGGAEGAEAPTSEPAANQAAQKAVEAEAARLQKAVGHYRRALELERAAPGGRSLPRRQWQLLVTNAGIALAVSGDLVGAEDAFRYGVSVDPGHPTLRFNLAAVLAEQGGRKEEVMGELRAVVDTLGGFKERQGWGGAEEQQAEEAEERGAGAESAAGAQLQRHCLKLDPAVDRSFEKYWGDEDFQQLASRFFMLENTLEV
jgi:hypothetical protein